VTISARAALSLAGTVTVEEVEVREPRRGEVLVELKASGVCHTDYDIMQAARRFVLGHEGAGVVAVAGEGVESVSAGDRVMLNWAMPCGHCFQCGIGNQHLCERQSALADRRMSAHDDDVTYSGATVPRAFQLGTMSTHTVVREEALWQLPADIPFASAAIIGCGVMTGFGSVVNVGRVPPGASVVVIGCGGVGLSVVQAARLSGANPLIAVDRRPSRLEMARQFGATVALVPDADDDDLRGVARRVRELTDDRGADFAFESTGVPALAASPLLMVRHGGMAVQVSGSEQPLTIDMTLFEFDKTYVNPLYGHCSPARDFPRILDLYARGDLLLDEMVTRTYSLDEVALAFEDMLSGVNAKGVLVME
jgi:Zn-dependent alcohol dehydrogenase